MRRGTQEQRVRNRQPGGGVVASCVSPPWRDVHPATACRTQRPSGSATGLGRKRNGGFRVLRTEKLTLRLQCGPSAASCVGLDAKSGKLTAHG